MQSKLCFGQSATAGANARIKDAHKAEAAQWKERAKIKKANESRDRKKKAAGKRAAADVAKKRDIEARELRFLSAARSQALLRGTPESPSKFANLEVIEKALVAAGPYDGWIPNVEQRPSEPEYAYRSRLRLMRESLVKAGATLPADATASSSSSTQPDNDASAFLRKLHAPDWKSMAAMMNTGYWVLDKTPAVGEPGCEEPHPWTLHLIERLAEERRAHDRGQTTLTNSAVPEAPVGAEDADDADDADDAEKCGRRGEDLIGAYYKTLDSTRPRDPPPDVSERLQRLGVTPMGVVVADGLGRALGPAMHLSPHFRVWRALHFEILDVKVLEGIADKVWRGHCGLEDARDRLQASLKGANATT